MMRSDALWHVMGRQLSSMACMVEATMAKPARANCRAIPYAVIARRDKSVAPTQWFKESLEKWL